LEAVIALQQTAADATESYQHTARALVELIGLDLGLVLLRTAEGWAIAGSHVTSDSVSVSYSRTLLNHVATERRTFYQDVNMFKSASVSLGEIEAVVASPIFGRHDDVVGVLYGMRTRGVLARGGVRRLEAQLVQLLAATVGSNLARFTTEQTGQVARPP
jgi:adenylate cyclase